MPPVIIPEKAIILHKLKDAGIIVIYYHAHWRPQGTPDGPGPSWESCTWRDASSSGPSKAWIFFANFWIVHAVSHMSAAASPASCGAKSLMALKMVTILRWFATSTDASFQKNARIWRGYCNSAVFWWHSWERRSPLHLQGSFGDVWSPSLHGPDGLKLGYPNPKLMGLKIAKTSPVCMKLWWCHGWFHVTMS